ncbi:hypothetical protein D9M71_367350 [compost metagenome]
MGVVGQQALAAAAALRCDCPVVGSGYAEHLQRGDLLCGAVDGSQAGNLPAEFQALELVGFVEWQCLVGVDRQQPGEFVGTDLLRHHQRRDFFLQVDRQAEVEQGEDQRRVFRLPVFRPVAGLGEVHRQVVAVAIDVGVDPARVSLEEALQARRRAGIEHVGALLQVHRAHETVDLQYARTEHFRQPPLGHQAQADHLAETVAGMHVAFGEQRIVEGAGFDQRHAQRVAADRHVIRQSLDRLHARGRRQAAGVAIA